MYQRSAFRILTVTLALTSLSHSLSHADELSSRFEEKVQNWSLNEFQRIGVTSVQVGNFQDVRNRDNMAGGVALANELRKALELNKVPVSSNARYTMHGKYEIEPDPKDPGLIDLRISFVLARQTGEEVKEFRDSVPVRNAAIISKLTGRSFEGAGRTAKDDRLILARRIDQPTVSVRPTAAGETGTVVRTSDTSPFGMELLAKESGGQPRPTGVSNAKGTASTRLQAGDVYQIRLINDSAEPAAVELLVDGVSVLALNENPALHGARLIIEPRSSRLVRGWLLNDRPGGANEFEVGKRADAVALKVLPADKAKLGVITASFSKAWDAKNPPIGRVPVMDGDQQVATVLGTGFDQAVQLVDYDFGQVLNVISLHYNSNPPENLP